MTKIIVNAEFRAKLAHLKQPVELCDESGRTLGYFRPVPSPEDYDLTCPFSEEEIRERRKQRTGRPLPDILADLEKP